MLIGFARTAIIVKVPGGRVALRCIGRALVSLAWIHGTLRACPSSTAYASTTTASAVRPAGDTHARIDDLAHTTGVPLLALAAPAITATVLPAVHAVARVDRYRAARNRGPQQWLGRQR